MNFKSTYPENLALKRKKKMNRTANKMATKCYLEVQILQYNALLYHAEKICMEIINFRLFNECIGPLFEG